MLVWSRIWLQVASRCRCESTVASAPVALRSAKGKSHANAVQQFVDYRKVRTSGGKGGDGCISFLQLWANDAAGPDGGDGGSGGHVIFEACTNVNDLHHVNTIIKGDDGENGFNKDCNGKSAKHTVVKVPVGTILKDSDGAIFGDLECEGAMFVAARGGAGGHGNHFFAMDTNQSPQIAQYGAYGENITYALELRSIAHFGLVGFPNAGKSTLLQAISRARPKVAPYPFTTLKPHLGMIQYSDYEQIAVADLPGLIEGSHKNRGLGIGFLRHIERCLALVFLLDAADDPCRHLNLLRKELTAFNKEILTRPQIIIANKIDLPEAKEKICELEKFTEGEKLIQISAKHGTNLSLFLEIIRSIYDEDHKTQDQSPAK